MFDKLKKIWHELDGGIKEELDAATAEVEKEFADVKSQLMTQGSQIAALQAEIIALKSAK